MPRNHVINLGRRMEILPAARAAKVLPMREDHELEMVSGAGAGHGGGAEDHVARDDHGVGADVAYFSIIFPDGIGVIFDNREEAHAVANASGTATKESLRVHASRDEAEARICGENARIGRHMPLTPPPPSGRRRRASSSAVTPLERALAIFGGEGDEERDATRRSLVVERVRFPAFRAIVRDEASNEERRYDGTVREAFRGFKGQIAQAAAQALEALSLDIADGVREVSVWSSSLRKALRSQIKAWRESCGRDAKGRVVEAFGVVNELEAEISERSVALL